MFCGSDDIPFPQNRYKKKQKAKTNKTLTRAKHDTLTVNRRVTLQME
jgi:hypothetical protein